MLTRSSLFGLAELLHSYECNPYHAMYSAANSDLDVLLFFASIQTLIGLDKVFHIRVYMKFVRIRIWAITTRFELLDSASPQLKVLSRI